jgi:imidazoleglycerol-phosphate dehydratase/histidinol-phosphatase
MSTKVLFIDRDGTLIEEPHDNQVDALDKVRLVRGVIPALLELANNGYRFVMVSNQDGLGTDSFPREHFETCHEHVVALFESQGITFDETFICPHFDTEGCDCRKPRTGLLTRYLAGNDLDATRSAVIGDRTTDLELAQRLGLRGFLVDPNASYETSWAGIVAELCNGDRVAEKERTTKETRIRARVNLDTEGRIDVRTGIGFFDHMLEQIAKHGGFSLDLNCDGDLHIDEHHTVEDVAIVLGSALREALGDKRGIGRYGFLLPMDESAATVALDLSGRANFVFDAVFPRDSVGEMSTEMVSHFFRSLAESLGAALHLSVSGENTHHMVEACFKAVGRSLRQAIRQEGAELPTTKGTLG